MQPAASDLLGLGVQGLQLTPGNAPTPNFQAWLTRQSVQIRRHHGFHWRAMRQRVWGPTGECWVSSQSVHPPQRQEALPNWTTLAEQGIYQGLLLETMYPGYYLGDDLDLQWAMDLQLGLAVDVSHIHIQRCQGSLNEATWKRLQAYPHIGELHVSANAGHTDSHQPLIPATFGLAWVQERAQDQVPVVLECYMHRLSQEQRLQQVHLALELLNLQE